MYSDPCINLLSIEEGKLLYKLLFKCSEIYIFKRREKNVFMQIQFQFQSYNFSSTPEVGDSCYFLEIRYLFREISLARRRLNFVKLTL